MIINYLSVLLLLLLNVIQLCVCQYYVGVGRADVTGPPVEITFMGYAKLDQKGTGIHLRQYARSFIIDDGINRILFVSVDSCMMGYGVKKKVLENLRLYYNDTYRDENVIISGIHTHSTPGGFLMDMLFDITSKGFVWETFNSLVSGIVLSVTRAHNSIQKGKIYYSSGFLLDANINRSPSAYLENPKEERNLYEYDVDKEMVQLRFVTEDNQPIGEINWFAVHPTSLNNTNTLVSSDNMGLASLFLENYYNPEELVGRTKYVGTFASSNLGDVSPNTKGPVCEISGGYCDNGKIKCPIKNEQCFASGPGRDMFESNQIIAEKLFSKAKEISEGVLIQLEGPVKFIHQYVDMPSQKAVYYNFTTGEYKNVSGCLPAMGYSFAAGTTDGPGLPIFNQETKKHSPFWNAIRNFVAEPSKEDIACQAPKPILLPTGRMNKPLQWQPKIVSVQLASIGDFYLAAVPGEFTTMSGRRLRNVIMNKILERDGPSQSKVVIAGLSNIYSDYIVTPEEYQIQRYEAASTIYGPYTLNIYLKLYDQLADALIGGYVLPKGPLPPDLIHKVQGLNLPVFLDLSREFGECVQQPPKVVYPGQTVVVKFLAGNPRNNLMHEKSYLTVERYHAYNKTWEVVATDSDWTTKFHWYRPKKYLPASSEVKIEWSIPLDIQPGVFRIRHFGYYKKFLILFSETHAYHGECEPFEIIRDEFSYF